MSYSRYASSSYVPGTFVHIPERLLKFRDQYKVIGKNTFYKNKHSCAASSKTIEQELYALLDKHRPGDAPPTWTALMKLTDEKKQPPTWIKCTPKQVEEYKKARAPYDKFVADTLANIKARRVRINAAKAKAAISELEKQGYKVSAPPYPGLSR